MDRSRKVLVAKCVGYPLFFLFCLVFFFPMLLPAAQIKSLVQQEFEKTAGQRLEIGYAGTGLLGGLVFRDLAVMPLDADPKDTKAAKFRVEEVRLGLPLLKLITGRKAVDIKVSAFEGTISGMIGAKGTMQEASLSLSDVNLAKMGSLWESLGVKFAGKLNGDFDIVYDTGDAKKDNGVVSLRLEDFTLTEGKYMGFELPKMMMGKVTGRIDVKDGKAEVKEFKGKGKDIELKGEGQSNLAPRISTSGMTVKFRFKPSDDFVQRNQKLQPLLYTIQSSKDKDGFYVFQVTGSLERPYFSMGR
ncbi:MAG: type II secretion system protein GspN [Myxococcota bacterium]|jgi:type II secretion system protein N